MPALHRGVPCGRCPVDLRQVARWHKSSSRPWRSVFPAWSSTSASTFPGWGAACGRPVARVAIATALGVPGLRNWRPGNRSQSTAPRRCIALVIRVGRKLRTNWRGPRPWCHPAILRRQCRRHTNSLARSRACCLSTQNAMVCLSSPRFFHVPTTSPNIALLRIARDNSFDLNSRAIIDTSRNASLDRRSRRREVARAAPGACPESVVGWWRRR